MWRLPALVLTIALALFISNPADAASVVQGELVSDYTTGIATIKVNEYDINITNDKPNGNPTGTITEFEISDAMIGAKPEKGNILRIAFIEEGGKKKALKIMNVTKQDLRKQK
jgi:hypothetical protein